MPVSTAPVVTRVCRFCEETIPAAARVCPQCNRDITGREVARVSEIESGPPATNPQVLVVSAPTPAVAKVFWVLSLLAAIGGGLIGLIGVTLAKSAPQEASAAAIGCLIVIAPYVVARGIQELTR